MLTVERPQFEDELAVLCAGFDVPATTARKEAYWRALNRMQLGTFTRLVEFALSEDGPDDLPTAPKLWQLYRELRTRWNRPAEPEQHQPVDAVQSFGNLQLLAFLMRQTDRTGHGASQASLIELARATNAITAAAQDDPTIVQALAVDAEQRSDDDKAALKQLSEIYARAFEQRWCARTATEVAQDRELYARTSRMRSFTDEELARLRA